MRRTCGAYRRKSSARASGCPLRKRSTRPCGSSSIAFLLGERRRYSRGFAAPDASKYSAAGRRPGGGAPEPHAAPPAAGRGAVSRSRGGGPPRSARSRSARARGGRPRPASVVMSSAVAPGSRDQEVGVLLAHVGAADAKALEAGVLDEAGRRQLARRVLEVAAAAGVLERVLAPAQRRVLGDAPPAASSRWPWRSWKEAESTTMSRRDLSRDGAIAEVEPVGAARRAPCPPRGGGRRRERRSPTRRRRRRCRRRRRRRSRGCWRRRSRPARPCPARSATRPGSSTPASARSMWPCRVVPSLRASTVRPATPASPTSTLVQRPSTVTGRPSSRAVSTACTSTPVVPARTRNSAGPPTP